MSFDGCDNNCQVEDGWACSGGSSSKPDICEPNIIFNLTILPVKGSPSVIIVFPFALNHLEPWENILIAYTIPNNVLLSGFKVLEIGNNSIQLNFPPNLYNNQTHMVKIMISKPRSLLTSSGMPFYSKALVSPVTFPLIVPKTTKKSVLL